MSSLQTQREHGSSTHAHNPGGVWAQFLWTTQHCNLWVPVKTSQSNGFTRMSSWGGYLGTLGCIGLYWRFWGCPQWVKAVNLRGGVVAMIKGDDRILINSSHCNTVTGTMEYWCTSEVCMMRRWNLHWISRYTFSIVLSLCQCSPNRDAILGHGGQRRIRCIGHQQPGQ